MNDLTEKWKNKKLPQWKFYYVLYSGGIEPLLLNGENDFKNHSAVINSLIKEVLAPVPTYRELQSLESDKLAKNEGTEIIAELENEIKLLKTALKYSNKTAKVALDFIKSDVRYLNQVKLIKVMEEMINDTQRVLK